MEDPIESVKADMMREARENCHNNWMYEYIIDPETGEQLSKTARQPNSWIEGRSDGYKVTVSRAPFLSYEVLNGMINVAQNEYARGKRRQEIEERNRRAQAKEAERIQQVIEEDRERQRQHLAEKIECAGCGDVWTRGDMRWFENDAEETICGYCNRNQ